MSGSSKNPSQMRQTTFCFTDFNEKNITNGYKNNYKDYNDIIRGIAWGVETCPKTGRKHNQGFIQFYSTQRGRRLQKILGYYNIHIEEIQGKISDNSKYCSKEGDYTELGEFVSRGYRSDLHNIKDDLKNGASMYEIMENYTGDFIRYHSGISKMKALIDEEKSYKWRNVETTILQGKAGTGKTRYVTEKHGYKNVFKINGKLAKTDFWGSYRGQDILLIDDFNGWIQYSYLLQVLDGHPLELNIKNSHTFANWTKVYITSNVSMDRWYNNIQDNLYRRIDNCLEVSEGGNTGPPHLAKICKKSKKNYGGYSENEDYCLL